MKLFNKILSEATSLNDHHAKLDPRVVSTLIIQLTNCRLVRGKELVREDLLVRDGKILDPMRVFFVEKRTADLEIDCDDLIVAPGFIDTQLNGGFGRDFTNTDENLVDNMNYVSEKLLAYGVTAYCPTIISSEPRVYSQLLPLASRSKLPQSDGAYILGLHLEGPFINKACFCFY